ncbi:MAG: ABC transporter ATP-binding protein [Lachnospiraceae bacterium]|nr:ABC transporter ATP-binding protein [Lachnospiraceae bacterium]
MEFFMIRMTNINKGYMLGEEKLPILKNINFSVKKGEYVAILGPSGSGKTTLMNIIGCMDVMDSGEYYLDGMAIHATEEDDLTDVRNQKIGFIFQNYQLIPTYNVMQNIIMPLVMRGMTYKEAEKECMEIIKLLGLEHRVNHRPSELSGGQKQRVSIARALVGKPAILLADEPTGALDQSSGKDVLKLFKELNEMGNTIVMITHDLNVAQSAKRIVNIVDGEMFEG